MEDNIGPKLDYLYDIIGPENIIGPRSNPNYVEDNIGPENNIGPM